MNLGIDFHDTLTFHPTFFSEMIKKWGGNVYIVSGTPESDRSSIESGLEELGLLAYIDDILLGFEYDKNNMDYDHFHKMALHKQKLIEKYDINVYFDDNPYYVSHLKDCGILVFQTILSNEYINKYREKDTYFTSHLQEKQFDFLK